MEITQAVEVPALDGESDDKDAMKLKSKNGRNSRELAVT